MQRIDHFAELPHELARPPAGLALESMSDESILCRCESISCGQLRRQLTDHPHVMSADAAKLLTRVGMGLCQGRMCGDNAARVIASMRGLVASEVGAFQAQAPVKPVPLDVLVRGCCSRSNEHSQPR